MKVLHVTMLLGLLVSLGGCYYDPGYSYVRGNGYSGDAYYGGGGIEYDDGYAPGYSYYDPGYGYYSPGVVVGGVWYRDRDHYRDRGRGGWRGDPGRWQGHGPRPDPGRDRPPGYAGGGRPGWGQGPRPPGQGGPGHGWGGGRPGDGGPGHGWGGGRLGDGGHGPVTGRSPPAGSQHAWPRSGFGRP